MRLGRDHAADRERGHLADRRIKGVRGRRWERREPAEQAGEASQKLAGALVCVFVFILEEAAGFRSRTC